MSESTYAKKALPEWQKEHPEARTFRNNSGMAWQGEIGLKLETSKYKSTHERILKNPRPIFFGVGLPIKDKKTGRIKQKGGGDRIGWESKKIAAPCCGSCKMKKGCTFLYDIINKIEDKNIIQIYYALEECFCEGKTYEPSYSKKIAVFLNLEVKTKNVPESKEQKQFREMVIAAGGISIILREE